MKDVIQGAMLFISMLALAALAEADQVNPLDTTNQSYLVHLIK